jgi:hypothetical protein
LTQHFMLHQRAAQAGKQNGGGRCSHSSRKLVGCVSRKFVSVPCKHLVVKQILRVGRLATGTNDDSRYKR